MVESLREFSYMFPPGMMVGVFCTSSGSMYPGNLTRTILERGRLSARSADSPLPPNPGEKTRIRMQDSDVKWGRGWLSGGGLAGGESQLFPPMRSMDTPALGGIIDKGTARKVGGAMAHWPNIGFLLSQLPCYSTEMASLRGALWNAIAILLKNMA